MKKTLFFVCLIASFLIAGVGLAQSEEEQFSLSMRRDFGYSSGSGDIQGTFSMNIRTNASLEKVVFLMDGKSMGEDNEAPYKLQFNTDSYAMGLHTLSATGYTYDGRQLQSNEIRAKFVSASEGWQTAMKMIVPILVIVFGGILLTFVLPIILRKGKNVELPLGTPRSYGLAGGGICSRCRRPFALHVMAPNMLMGKLERCPYCGKWGIVHHRSLNELRAAEAAELEQAQTTVSAEPLSEADKLRKELNDSRYQDS